MLNKHLLIPMFFVILYGSGYAFTKFGLENSSPMLFLLIRFFIAFFILLLIVFIFKHKFPKNIKEYLNIAVAGSLTVGTFSIGAILSLHYGNSASLSALIIATQPILVSFLAMYFLKEAVNKRVFLGLLIGFIGVSFVVLDSFGTQNVTFLGLFWALVSLFGLSIGTIYQKKYCVNMNLYSGGMIQTLASTLLCIPFLFFENIYLEVNSSFIIAILFMAIGVSIGALSLLYVMIRLGEVSKVSSIFYLVPISAALISFIFFNKTIEISVVIGIFIVMIGIALINKKSS